MKKKVMMPILKPSGSERGSALVEENPHRAERGERLCHGAIVTTPHESSPDESISL